MSNATERIKRYCTEVTQAQWEELVRVAHENGIGKGYASKKGNIALLHIREDVIWLVDKEVFIQSMPRESIPFPDFLAKLRGVDEWEPKAGEMVEVSDGDDDWQVLEFVSMRKGFYVCWWNESEDTAAFSHCRPLRPTITRAEAEQQLGKRIID